MMMIKLRFLLLAAVLAALSAPAFAQCPEPTVPVNRSTEIDPAFYDDQVLAGCDPYCPDGNMDYCQHGGTRRGSPGSGGAAITTDVSKSRMDCPPTKKMDTTCAFEYPACNGEPGGRLNGGALSVCNKGIGLDSIFDLPEFVLDIFDIFPDFSDAFMACLGNMIFGIAMGNDVNIQGSFTTNVTLSNTNPLPTSNPPCAGASVGFCGFNLNGEVCGVSEEGEAAGDEGDATVAGVDFFQLDSAASSILFGTDLMNTQGPVIMTGGGILTGPAGNIAIAPGTILTTMIGSDGLTAAIIGFPAGTPIADIVSGAAVGIADTLVDLTLYPGVYEAAITDSALIPIETVTLGALDDSARIPGDIADLYLVPPCTIFFCPALGVVGF